MYVVRDVLKSNISVIVRNYLLHFFQQPKNQRIKTFPSQISGIFFLIYKGHVMFYTSGEYNPINLISIDVFCIYSSLC